ncbi:rRNA maturation RNase YbeY [Sulfuriroseicoccus oceanibius]|uniref:Endoribonuclease YbeY n=1 Tax=Sulfuriroseicoccus oceanibius TaxID=2707525 RepID=A0A6B3L034_9BACT|nr:rRNA maturation RNase YbeY [Sulfuriroseicoccus oceanibius]QQL43696.1 rRNA maturation RNase YbeY [Sulfuriroseicoccus oceanibius]
MSASLEICVSNQHPALPFDEAWLESLMGDALEACLAQPGSHPERMVLPVLDELDVALVDDETIADVHVRFMDIPGETDVITFDHGEIVISLDTAQRYAKEFGNGFVEEVARYAVHGLLHLNGHEDAEEGERAAMHREQERILAESLARVAPYPASSGDEG